MFVHKYQRIQKENKNTTATATGRSAGGRDGVAKTAAAATVVVVICIIYSSFGIRPN